MAKQDRIVYTWSKGKWVQYCSQLPPPEARKRANFLIVSHFGKLDWSGFRPLDECFQDMSLDRESGFYQIIERL